MKSGDTGGLFAKLFEVIPEKAGLGEEDNLAKNFLFREQRSEKVWLQHLRKADHAARVFIEILPRINIHGQILEITIVQGEFLKYQASCLLGAVCSLRGGSAPPLLHVHIQ